MHEPEFSVVIPVYNRPQEVEEILSSLTAQSFKDFEVIIVEDGSDRRCDDVVSAFSNKLRIEYYFKPNTGPGPSRNFGFSHANGRYFVVFDSDCILPPEYLQIVKDSLTENNWDAWGGPDKAHTDFTLNQRAMAYTMSSFFTTGGIRGGKKHIGWFQPRSFNMGLSRKVFEATGGFKFDRYAEDIEFSIRMKQAGFKVGLIPDAFVYHKRRISFRQFYNQVYNFGRGRAMIGQVYPEEVKLTHWFPTLFLTGIVALLLIPFVSPPLFGIGIAGLTFYLAAILVDSLLVNRNLMVAILSIPASFCQLFGYGMGFLAQKLRGNG